jgi:hypothetical protein
MTTSKFAEQNFVEFIDGEDGLDDDIIRDRFFDYLYRNSTLKDYRVSPRESYRIDLIADNIYGNKNLYWILNRLNAFMCVTEYSEGRTIKYADMPDIESAYMAWKETARDDSAE